MDSSDRLSGVLFTLGLCILSRLWVNDREHIGAGRILRVNGMSANRGYLSIIQVGRNPTDMLTVNSESVFG